MKPIETEYTNVVYAKDQPEYIPLPAYQDTDGTIVTTWELTKEEIEAVKESGRIYLMVSTFNQPLQPVLLTTTNPIIE
jgi:hypothetical protein